MGFGLRVLSVMWTSDPALYVLPPEYNVRYRKYLEVWTEREATPKILHLAEYYDDLEQAPGGLQRANNRLRHAARLCRRLLGR